jgi:hypothetical protein
MELKDAFIEVWRQVLVEEAQSVKLGAESFSVRRTSKQGLRQVDFIFEHNEIRGLRRVSTTLRHMLTEFSEFFHVSWTGLLIHASVGTAGGLGTLRTKRSG